MKSLLKKNHLMITALAVMIAIAGYLQFTGNVPGTQKEEQVSSLYTDDTGLAGKADYIDNPAFDITSEDLAWAGDSNLTSLDSEKEMFYVEDYDLSEEDTLLGQTPGTPEEGETPGEAIFTSTTGLTVVSDAKLLKEQTRARNKEMLLEIIETDGLTEVQKQTAVDSMVRMTEIAEKEAAAEMLLEAKGFQDVVVSINGNSADVVVNAITLDEIKRAQIEDIVKRKTEVPAENIIISTVVQ